MAYPPCQLELARYLRDHLGTIIEWVTEGTTKLTVSVELSKLIHARALLDHDDMWRYKKSASNPLGSVPNDEHDKLHDLEAIFNFRQSFDPKYYIGQLMYLHEAYTALVSAMEIDAMADNLEEMV